MKQTLKMILFGVLTWLVPMVVGIFCYSKEGELIINQDLFKSIMIIVGSGIGSLLLVFYFKKLNGSYLKQGIIVGLVWLAINYVLDLVITMPMSQLSLADYMAQIGLRYLVIPMTSMTIGYLLEKKARAETAKLNK